MSSYIKGLFHGLGTLLTGLKVTGREFFTPKITEQYPENRATLKMYDRFCGSLTMPHDAEGRNRCIACGLCHPPHDRDGRRPRDGQDKKTAGAL